MINLIKIELNEGTVHDAGPEPARRQVRLPQPTVHVDVDVVAQLPAGHGRRQRAHTGTLLPAGVPGQRQQLPDGSDGRAGEGRRRRRRPPALGQFSRRVHSAPSNGISFIHSFNDSSQKYPVI